MPSSFLPWMIKGLFVYGFLLTWSLAIYGQTQAFSWLEHVYTPEELESVLEEWAYYRDHPLDLNDVTKSELLQLPAMTPDIADLIIAFQSSNAPLQDKQQLRQISEIPDNLLAFLLPQFTLSTQRIDQKKGFIKRDILLRTRNSTGQSFLPYFPIYGRVHLSIDKDITFSVVADHDAGERFYWSRKGQKAGFDHLVGYMTIQEKGFIRKLVLGNYTVSLGSGLLVDNRLFTSKPYRSLSKAVALARLSPYRSSTEYSYFRGAGLLLGTSDLWDVLVFASSRWQDASLHAPEIQGQDSTVRSIRTSGLHRTPSERAAENTLREQVAGLSLSYSLAHVLIRWSGLCSRYSRAFTPEKKPENKYQFNGTDYCGQSVVLQHAVPSLTFFTEWSVYRGRSALYSLLQLPLWRRGTAQIVFRKYAAGFVSLYGRGSGQQSRPQHEQGLTLSLSFEIQKGWKLTTFTDQYHFDWISATRSMATHGQETGLRWESAHENGLFFNAQFKQESFEHNHVTPLSTNQAIIHPEARSRNQLNASVGFDGFDKLKLSLMTRFKQSQSKEIKEKAWLIGQRVEVGSRESFKLRIQHALFETASTELRFSIWEPDVRYAFSLKPVTRPGSRLTLHVLKQLKGKLIEFRYSRKHTKPQPFSFNATKPQTNSDVHEIVIQVQFSKR